MALPSFIEIDGNLTPEVGVDPDPTPSYPTVRTQALRNSKGACLRELATITGVAQRCQPPLLSVCQAQFIEPSAHAARKDFLPSVSFITFSTRPLMVLNAIQDPLVAS
jgi:hypothetical protein